MHDLTRTRRVIRPAIVTLALASLLFQTACGTLIHPERRGQSGGRIDPAIAILDGIGLLFFVIPGLVAFAVDFSTGAIYLPPGEASADDASDDHQRVVYVDPDELTPERIEAVIQAHTGQEVSVTTEDVQVLRGEDATDVDNELARLSPAG